MYNILPLGIDGEGHWLFTLGNIQVHLVTRFNYTAACWTLDILDASGNLMVAGIMMVPGINLIKPYPQITGLIGGLMVVELNVGDYQSPSLLGTNIQLLWFPVGTPVAL